MSLVTAVIIPLIEKQLSSVNDQLASLALKELKTLGHAVIHYVENHCLHKEETKSG